ncbi:MAG: DUF881 domain-containing protein [Ornithinimicrobium sp.]|uniref:DUF881 domain-containing protein n=1 Tax=Ornithinimicrobium sp. TaxID=1977084 RepID=UPI003D9B5064
MSESAPAAAASGGARAGRWRWAVPVMALGAGLLFGTSAALARATGFGDEPADLADLIQQRTATVEQLSSRVGDLSLEIEQLEGQVGRSGASTDVSALADELAPLIGTGAVRGPAITVTLDDAGYTEATLPEGYTVDDVVVHQQDVQGVVNALWVGGAEAMMVQDQRIVATSAVRCVGNTLYLQGRVYSPPYTITAIGDRQAMAASLAADPIVSTYRGWSETLGLGYVVQQRESVRLPAFEGTIRPEHVVVGADPDEQAPDGVTRDDGAATS